MIGGLVLALASLFTSFALQMHQVLLRCVTTITHSSVVRLPRSRFRMQTVLNCQRSSIDRTTGKAHASEIEEGKALE